MQPPRRQRSDKGTRRKSELERVADWLIAKPMAYQQYALGYLTCLYNQSVHDEKHALRIMQCEEIPDDGK